MTIACGDDTYRVHKAIMCPRSKYFETSFKVDMQVSEQQACTKQDVDKIRS